MPLPPDYLERLYAGILGKIIGVYLGRPFEGWSHERIQRELGEIWYYVHEKLGMPLVVTDDDISGTFTFIRALEDYAHAGRNVTPRQIGQTWLNYIIENRTILWWGGLGMSTEHTAFLRLKRGIPAPESGSMRTNSQIVAEQIGAQIFIDGWGMVAPGDPPLAADLARKAASVSHDGEAIYAAQVVAAMESAAFVERDINRLIDIAIGLIPADCLVRRMIDELREFHTKEKDWRKAFADLMLRKYGYDKYGGNCHVIPNHGLIILSLLYGEDDFQKSLMIVNTCGWDTDCNAGNVGCIMGIRNGLAGIAKGPDWRSPIADRIYLPTADGGSCITDAVTQTYRLANIARSLSGEQPLAPKNGAKFHFSLPGSTQGFIPDDSPESRGTVRLSNPLGHGLTIQYEGLAPGRVGRVFRSTFIPPDAWKMPGYAIVASPTLYPGQTVTARLRCRPGSEGVRCRLYLRSYGAEDALVRTYGPEVDLRRMTETITWTIPNLDGAPIAEIGLEFSALPGHSPGELLLDYLTWSGSPDVVFKKPAAGGTMWQRAWVDSGQSLWWGEDTYRIVSNEGTALLSQGTRDWADYSVFAAITPHMVQSAGLAAHVQGLKRYYALLLCRDGKAKLVKSLDGDYILAEAPFKWEFGQTFNLALRVQGNHIEARIDDRPMFSVTDDDHPLTSGAIALVCEEGRCGAGPVTIRPA